MDKYFAYILASYLVTFGAITLLTAAIIVRYRAALRAVKRLEEQGIRRRSDKLDHDE